MVSSNADDSVKGAVHPGVEQTAPLNAAPELGQVSAVAEDYLKVVWSAHEWADDPVTTKWLAARLGVGASTVSDTVRRLSAQGLLAHEPYGAITLTQVGREHAVQVVRRHRILETFLVEQLGYTWDEVHEEAEVLEHAVSPRLIDRVDALLGHPIRDPHGDPIPGPDGSVDIPQAIRLADLPVGATGVVVRISDSQPEVLRYFTGLNLGLDASVTVLERREYAGTVRVRWVPVAKDKGTDAPQPHNELDLGFLAAESIWVTAL